MKRDIMMSVRLNSDLYRQFKEKSKGISKVSLADFLEYSLIQYLGLSAGKEGTETMEEPAAGSLVSETTLL